MEHAGHKKRMKSTHSAVDDDEYDSMNSYLKKRGRKKSGSPPGKRPSTPMNPMKRKTGSKPSR